MVRVIQRAAQLPDPVCTQPDNKKTHMDAGVIHAPVLSRPFLHICHLRLVEKDTKIPQSAGAVELTPKAAAKWAKKLVRIFAKQKDSTADSVKDYSKWIQPSPTAVILLTEKTELSTPRPWEPCRCPPDTAVAVGLCLLCGRPR